MKRKILAVILSALMLALVIVPAAAMGEGSPAKRAGEPTEKIEPVNNAASVRKAEEPKEETEPVIDDTVVSKVEDPEPDEGTNDSVKITEEPGEQDENAEDNDNRLSISALSDEELLAFLREHGIFDAYRLIFCCSIDDIGLMEGCKMWISCIEEDSGIGLIGGINVPGPAAFNTLLSIAIDDYYGIEGKQYDRELDEIEKYYSSLLPLK